jgi:lipopolysaccharide biosynthesis protein
MTIPPSAQAAYQATEIQPMNTGSSTDLFEGCEVLIAQQPPLEDGEPPVGVVIHVYYPEVLRDILVRLTKLPERLHLYVTCVAGHDDGVCAQLAASGLSYSLYRVPNHGRDVLPFLRMLPFLRADNIHTLVKLHTKRSLRLGAETDWGLELFDDLLSPVRFRRSLENLADPLLVPMLGTQRYLLPVTKNLNKINGTFLVTLAERAGIDPQGIDEADFFAGTMFIARTEMFAPLQRMQLTGKDFETECGQLDSTLAHALECFFGVLANVGRQQRSIDLYRRWLATRQLAAVEVEGLPARLASWPRQPDVLLVLTDTTGDIGLLRCRLISIERQIY